mgnify:CR=1 FL=1
MMGQQAGGQERLFYSFNLEDHVPADHLLRGIDQFLDLSELRQPLSKYCSHTGRPSIDPELMMRMLIRRLQLRHSFGTPPVRGSAPESRLSLVLSSWPRGCRTGSFHFLQEPAWAIP